MVDRSIKTTRFDVHGTALQMARMLPNKPTQKKSSYFDLSSSEDEEETVREDRSQFSQAQASVQQNVHTLASIMALQQQIQKTEAEKPRVPEREIRSMPTNNFGVDPNLFKMIYNLGYDAGLDKRDPIPPCGVCEERRRKNRIAAAEQRKRLREDGN
jgi:hypothetical protein